jgi:hypothetical protein
VSVPKKPETNAEWERFVMQFIGSLALCDHLGDVGEDVGLVLEVLGHKPEWEYLGDLLPWLHEHGVTTLYGTSLGEKG